MIKSLRNRQPLLALFLVASIVLSACGSSQATTKMTTIGIISYVQTLDPLIDGFKAGMADLGYVEGKTVTYIYHGVMSPDPEPMDKEIQGMIKDGASIFIAMGTVPAERVKKAIEGTQMTGVFAPVVNPVELGLISDLRKPGGRLTGIDSGGPLLEKGMEWMLTAVPNVKRVHLPYRNSDDNIKTELPMLVTTAEKLKVELLPQGFETVDEAIAAISTYDKATDGIYTVPALLSDPAGFNKYLGMAVQNGIPVGSSYVPVVFGPLVTVQPDWFAVGKQVARLTDQIVKGSDPGTIPVETADFTYSLNMLTANGLGLNLPDSVLSQAKTIFRGEETAKK